MHRQGIGEQQEMEREQIGPNKSIALSGLAGLAGLAGRIERSKEG